MGELAEKVLAKLREAALPKSVTRPAAPTHQTDPHDSSEAQRHFDLNCGHNTQAPPIRATLYQPGATVVIKSPCFGVFRCEVIKDNGAILWIFSPFLGRETAIPSGWIVREGHAHD